MSVESEEILVLYGSQTGNSEQAAIDISSQISEKLSSKSKTYTSRHMQLDDFLEIEKAQWTRNVIIVTSSYGVGQAPLGCYRFRAFCDFISQQPKQCSKLLDGIHFALLGLGDSGYTTFFRNPTVINEALLSAGAIRVGDVGKADASGKGDNSQDKVIKRWIDGIWDPLKEVLNEQPEQTDSVKEKLEKNKRDTFEMTQSLLSSKDDKGGKKLDENNSSSQITPMNLLIIALLVVLLAIILGSGSNK